MRASTRECRGIRRRMRSNRRACRNKRRHRRPMCHGNHLKRRSRRNFRRHSSRKVARVALFSSTTAHKAATTARKAPAATLIADDGNPESDSDDAYFASDGAESADALAFSASGNAKTASERLFGVLARRSAGAVRMSAFGQGRTYLPYRNSLLQSSRLSVVNSKEVGRAKTVLVLGLFERSL